MRRTRQIFTGVLFALGVALVVYGFSDGLWPLSVQSVAGVLIIVYAAVRWRML